MAKLNFIVFGMPRSGTSATTNYLSAIEGVFCGQEVFPVGLDHSTIDAPGDFLRSVHAKWRDTAVEDVSSRGSEIHTFGNKAPDYYLRLSRVMEELDWCPAVCCVRDLTAIVRSYSMRSKDENDPWLPGRHGIYAAGDALLLIHALRACPDHARILIVPHKSLLNDWRQTICSATDFMFPDVGIKFDAERIDRIHQSKEIQGKREKASLSKLEEKALEKLIEVGGINELFSMSEVVQISEVRALLDDIAAKCPPHPVQWMRRVVENQPNDEIKAYFPRWEFLASRCWRGLAAVKTAQALSG